MAKELNKVQYYYDFHPTEEDLMGETSWKAQALAEKLRSLGMNPDEV